MKNDDALLLADELL